MMASHHRLEDNSNCLDRVVDHILTHKSLKDCKLVIQWLVTDPDED